MNPPAFTANQLSAALGKTKRAVLMTLREVPASSEAIVRGHRAGAWTIAALPLKLREELAIVAEARGYRDAAHFLTTPPAQVWPPPGFPKLSEIAQHCVDKASKLQRALAHVLALQNDLSRTSGELEQIGLADYQREFGYTITDRALRSLVKRTIERDAGCENFTRLELYLDERPARLAPLPSKPRPGDEVEFRELREVIATFKNTAAPTAAEFQYLWLRAFEIHEAHVAEGKPAKRTARALVRFLFAVMPSLANHEAALRKKFKRMLARWQKNEQRIESLTDKRTENSGHFRSAQLHPEDVQRIVWEAGKNCRGRILQAAKRLCAKNELQDPALKEWAIKGCSSRSGVYRQLLALGSPQARQVRKYVLDENAAYKSRPHMDLDGTNVRSMKAVVVDDFTLPVRVRVPDGKGWWRLTRGQCILATDYATDCALSFGLQQEEQPNSLIARTTLVRAFGEHGVPDILVVERGKVFADSKYVTGGERARHLMRNSETPFSDAEVSMGLRRFCEVIVSKHPRSKPVERVGDLVQALMSGEPGYTGIEERYDCPHETKYWTEQLKRKDPKSLEHFYTLEEWRERLKQIFFDEYNNKRRGDRTRKIPGLTPLEAFRQRWTHNEQRKIPPEMRFLLSHHRVDNVPVTEDGIRLQFRNKMYRYFDGQTGHWETFVGKPVTAWVDPEAPEFATFTDRNMQNAFTVPLHVNPVPFEFEETYQTEQAKSWAHVNAGKRLYAELKCQPWATFRPVIPSARDASLAVEITEQQGRAQAIRTEEQKRTTRLRKSASALGVNVPDRPRRIGQVEDGLEWEAEIRRKREANSKSDQPSQA